MTRFPRAWQDVRWTDFRDLPRGAVAVLPVAAIEQHGPHLPLSVDAVINAGILDRALRRLPPESPVLVLPMQSVGVSVEHARFPGTLTGSVETLIALWTEVGACVARAGVRKLVVLNSHGGQPQVVDIVCRRLRVQAAMLAVSCLLSRLGHPADVDLGAEEERHGIHGGLVETSMMLALRPDLVRMDAARNFRSAWIAREADSAILVPEGAVGFGWQAQDLHPAGALGDASRADAALGERLIDYAAERLALLLQDVHRLDLDTWLRDAPEA
jgi:creatinine amidohydrolase